MFVIKLSTIFRYSKVPLCFHFHRFSEDKYYIAHTNLYYHVIYTHILPCNMFYDDSEIPKHPFQKYMNILKKCLLCTGMSTSITNDSIDVIIPSTIKDDVKRTDALEYTMGYLWRHFLYFSGFRLFLKIRDLSPFNIQYYNLCMSA